MSTLCPKRVTIREVGPRDGLQIEPDFMPTEVKKRFISKLAQTGLTNIEITSFVHPKWIPALADFMEIGSTYANIKGVVTSALCPNMKGLENALKTGIQHLSVFMSVTDGHNKANLNSSVEQTLKLFSELIPEMRRQGMEVEAALSVAFGCPFEGIPEEEKVADICQQLVGYGAQRIALADTIGVGDPGQTQRLLQKVSAQVPIEKIGLHLHDTQGTGLANAMVGWQMGVSMFDGAVGGLGGCPYAPGASGNLATEALIYTFNRLGVETGVDLEKLLQVGEWLQQTMNKTLPSSGLKAYLGRKQAQSQGKPPSKFPFYAPPNPSIPPAN